MEKKPVVSLATQKFIATMVIDIVTWFGVKKDPNDRDAPGNQYRHGAWFVSGDLRIIYESRPHDYITSTIGYLSIMIYFHDELVFHENDNTLRTYDGSGEWLVLLNELHDKIGKK